MKKKFLSLILAMISILTLVACGSDSTNTDNKDESSQVESETVSNNTISSDKPNVLSKCFSTESNSVWYYVNKIDKNAEILHVYIFQDGQMLAYTLNNTDIKLTLGQVAQMTDAEVVSYVKEQYLNYLKTDCSIENRILQAKTDYEEMMSKINSGQEITYKYSWISSNWQVVDDCLVGKIDSGEKVRIPLYLIEEYGKKLDELSANIDKAAMELSAYNDLYLQTDSTGNNLSSENISIHSYTMKGTDGHCSLLKALETPMDDTLGRFMTASGETELTATSIRDYFYMCDFIYALNITQACDPAGYQIYDSYFGGYQINKVFNGMSWSDSSSKLITRIDENGAEFVLDELGTEGIPIY